MREGPDSRRRASQWGIRQPVEQAAQAALIAAVGIERSEFLGAASENRVLVGRQSAEPLATGRLPRSTVKPVASARA